jgi:histidine triad (HIT) family protein
MAKACAFCEIVAERVAAAIVFAGDEALAFLDHRPLFPGHVLLVPRDHIPTLADLPADCLRDFFGDVQLVGRAVENAMEAEGTFVAINNRVSQSVPHLHVHIVPRRRGDGLKGFFWPRRPYSSEEHLAAVQQRIRAEVQALRSR